MWKLGCFIILAFTELSYSQDECYNSFLCDESVCESICGPNNCKPPDGKECNGMMLPLYTNPEDICSCCADNKKCVSFLEEGAPCQPTSTELTPRFMCGPGLTCDPQFGNVCKPMRTKCISEFEAMEEAGQGMNQSPPDCDDEGNYKPLQCQPGGLCRCVDKDSGEPIALGFGVAGGLGEAEASEMDCKCARQYHEALKVGCRMKVHLSDYIEQIDYVSNVEACEKSAMSKSAMHVSPETEKDIYFAQGQMRCLPNGNFDPIQCVDRTGTNGMCVCITIDLTGISANGSFAPIEETDELPCFDDKVHFPDYYRPCELKIHQMRKEKVEHAEKGRYFISREIPPTCNPDGYFAKVQTRSEDYNSLYCANKEGEKIEDFSGNRTQLSGRKMNCECALTREYLSLGSVKPTCCKNGNYQAHQCISGLCFCVDQFGRQTIPEVDQMEFDKTQCGDFCCEEATEDEEDFCYEDK